MSAGFVGKRPEEAGINQMWEGSAVPAFLYWMDAWSDIQDHLAYMFNRARGSVLELGVRGGVSTAALLAGVEKRGGKLFSVDIDPACAEAFRGHPQWEFFAGSSLDYDQIAALAAPMLPFDLIFIDTEHTYDQLKKELWIWAPFVRPGGMILIHDMKSFPDMAKAALDWCAENTPKDFVVILPGSNGLGIIHL